MSSAVAAAVTPAPVPSGRPERTRADRADDDRFTRMVNDAGTPPEPAPPKAADRTPPFWREGIPAAVKA